MQSDPAGSRPRDERCGSTAASGGAGGVSYPGRVEKIVYLLWSPAELSDRDVDAFRDRLLETLPEALGAEGVQRLKISVTDRDVASGAELHRGVHEPNALVSFWLECVRERGPSDALLASCSERRAGYLVAESQPLRIDTPEGGMGRRMPGFSLVGCIEPAAGVSQAEFIRRWEETHVQVAIETQSTFSYVRNEIVRPLTEGAPAWGGIVEEGFPSEALTDPRAFYDAGDSESRFQAHAKRMVESCSAFLDLERVDSHPMSEYRFF